MDERRSLFRASALKRHAERAEKSILPELMSARSILALWIVLGMVLLAVGLLSVTHLAFYAGGTAVMVEPRAVRGHAPTARMVVGFFPAESLDRLRIGQRVLLRPLAGRGRYTSSVLRIEPGVMSGEASLRRLDLDPDVMPPTLRAAAAVVHLRLPPDLVGAGAVFAAEVELRRPRMIDLLSFPAPVHHR